MLGLLTTGFTIAFWILPCIVLLAFLPYQLSLPALQPSRPRRRQRAVVVAPYYGCVSERVSIPSATPTSQHGRAGTENILLL